MLGKYVEYCIIVIYSSVSVGIRTISEKKILVCYASLATILACTCECIDLWSSTLSSAARFELYSVIIL